MGEAVYYIVFRGNPREHIWADESDRQMLLELLRNLQARMNFDIYAYCIVDDMVHIIVNAKTNNVIDITDGIVESYNHYLVEKQKPKSFLLSQNYQVEKIDEKKQMLQCCRYLHQLPVYDGLVSKIADYWWSSYTSYRKELADSIIDRSFIVSMFHSDSKKALKKFLQYNNIFEENEI